MQQMRKVMIMKGELSGAFNSMDMMGASLMDVPTINGSNIFIGDFIPMKKGSGISAAIDTQEDWEAYWGELGAKPPGDLPAGAVAIFQADSADDRAVTLEPKTIVQDADEITIEWDRMNIPHAEMTGAHSHYTVLLIPQGMLTANVMDSWPVAEERDRKAVFDAALEKLKTTRDEDTEAPARAMFMKKYKHAMTA